MGHSDKYNTVFIRNLEESSQAFADRQLLYMGVDCYYHEKTIVISTAFLQHPQH